MFVSWHSYENDAEKDEDPEPEGGLKVDIPPTVGPTTPMEMSTGDEDSFQNSDARKQSGKHKPLPIQQ